MFTAASDAFTMKNIKCNVKESLERFGKMYQVANQENIQVRGYVSTVMGCPYKGKIEAESVDLVV